MNNAAERAIRGIAVGRRNWTFAGSDADVIARLPVYPAKRVAELLPWNWSLPAAALKAA